jgi:hypothetical protein
LKLRGTRRSTGAFRNDAPQRRLTLAKSRGRAEHLRLPTQSWAELHTKEAAKWDKTSEVPEVHGALRWWALSKAVKPHFSKQYWRERAQSRASAASMPEHPSATLRLRPAITR